MSAGALLLASNTEPVREAVEDGVNGVLTNMDDIAATSARILDMLENRAHYCEMRTTARQTVLERYDLKACRDAMLELILGR